MKPFVLPPRIATLVADMRFEPIALSDPRVTECVEAYKAKYNLPDAQPDGRVWKAILHEDYLIAVYGEYTLNGRLNLTDFYMHPAAPWRLQIAAAYGVMAVYHKLFEAGVLKSVTTQVLYENVEWQRALKRVFGLVPKTVTYYSEGLI